MAVDAYLLAWGARGSEFESRHPDQFNIQSSSMKPTTSPRNSGFLLSFCSASYNLIQPNQCNCGGMTGGGIVMPQN